MSAPVAGLTGSTPSSTPPAITVAATSSAAVCALDALSAEAAAQVGDGRKRP